MDGMLTLKEVMDFLDLDQNEVERLVKRGTLSAYKIGGTFLRFKKDQVVQLKSEFKDRARKSISFFAKLRDYWYFNRIYLLSAVLVVLLFYYLMK